MAFISTLFVVLSATSALAQNQITWGTVAFTYHGEKVPFLARGSHHLTPLGATQMYNAGNAIRGRYIESPDNSTSTVDFAPIYGLSRTDIINSQLDVLTLDDEIMSGSAMAFMQGLYPPTGIDDEPSEEHLFAPGNSGMGSVLSYPLDGYQYPDIKTVNTLSDTSSIWIAGNMACSKYSDSEVLYKNTSAYQNRIASTETFYQKLRSSVFSEIPAPASAIDFGWADHLYEYALYEYTHNSSIFGFSNFTSAELARLYALASEQQFAINSPNSVGNVSSIAGQTMAAMVFQQFEHLMKNSYTNKLSLMITSFEPFLSFFALAGLATGPSGSRFRSIPKHGSIMAFELFSYSTSDVNDSTTIPFPPESDLYVRFLFRNGTGDDEKLDAVPLFGNSPSNTELQWYDFVNGMDEFTMRDVPDWCNVCAAETRFCMELANEPSVSAPKSNVGTSGNKRLSPTVSGAIGALVALALAVLAFLILAFFGFRLERKGKKPNKARNSDLGVLRTSSGNGGFKGAEKLASDTDLRLKGGAGVSVVRHERVGSWELNDGPRSPPPVYPSLNKDLESGRVQSHADYGRRSEDYDGLERIDPFGDPIRPADQI